MAELVTIRQLSTAGALAYGDGYRTKRSEHGRPGYRILRVADVQDGRVGQDGDDYVRAEFRNSIGPKLSQPGDILLTTKGTVGRVAIYPESAEQVVYSPQLCYFRVLDHDVICARYFSYWFKAEEFRWQAVYRANSTDMAAYINLRDIGSLEMRYVPVKEQRAVAEVLGALDDKIAANDRICRMVVELADAEFGRAVRSVPLGEETFNDVARVGGGGTPKTSVGEYWGGDVPWATPTDVTALSAPYLRVTGRYITESGLAACSSSLYPAGSILMTSRATIGAFALARVPVAVNQGFIVVNARDTILQCWLFHEMRSRVQEFLSHANGATFLELSRGRFKRLPVRLPAREVAARFGEYAQSLHEMAFQVVEESQRLANVRDELLPMLMSGKLRVKGAERVVEEVT